MLVLGDRAFDANAFLAQVDKHRLAAALGQIHPPPARLGHLPDGSTCRTWTG